MDWVTFDSVMGVVNFQDIKNSFLIMFQGTIGIFMVMAIIYLVILGLGKFFYKNNNIDSDK